MSKKKSFLVVFINAILFKGTILESVMFIPQHDSFLQDNNINENSSIICPAFERYIAFVEYY